MNLKTRNLNYYITHSEIDLDNKITPLTAASFLGRLEIVSMLLENPFIEVNMGTQDIYMTPLSSACAGGHYLIVKLLVDNGADVNLISSIDYSPL